MNSEIIKLGLPKGKIEKGVFSLLEEAGIKIEISSRAYRPSISLQDFDAKILKPQNILGMLDVGSRDIGFAGADWVSELDLNVTELIDTGLNPVKIVVAAPKDLLVDGKLPNRKLRIVSEYEKLTKNWVAKNNLDAEYIKSYGATEVFPPEDADCIVDNTATGSTLKANNLDIVDTVMTSSTRLFASKSALDNPTKKKGIDEFCLLINSVLEARKRVMLEVNVSSADLDGLLSVLPCMRQPTISSLHNEEGLAVKAAVQKKDLTDIIPALKEKGGTDIVVSKISQIVS